MKLAVGKVQDARAVYDYFSKKIAAPLMNFVGNILKIALISGFLICSIEIKSPKAFQELLNTYSSVIGFDDSFPVVITFKKIIISSF